MVDVRFETERVAAGARLDRGCAQHLPELGDVDLDALSSGCGRPTGPELLYELVGGDDLAPMQGQKGEERALLRRPEVERSPVLTGLERAEDVDFHAEGAKRPYR